jgi:hypothetical protein
VKVQLTPRVKGRIYKRQDPCFYVMLFALSIVFVIIHLHQKCNHTYILVFMQSARYSLPDFNESWNFRQTFEKSSNIEIRAKTQTSGRQIDTIQEGPDVAGTELNTVKFFYIVSEI